MVVFFSSETIAILALTGILIILAVATFILCRYIVRNNPESCPAKAWKAIKKCCVSFELFRFMNHFFTSILLL